MRHTDHMTVSQVRVPTGSPTGGRFATTARAEATVSLDAGQSSTVIAPSYDVIEKSLAMSGINVSDPISAYSGTEVREAFRIGHEMGAGSIARAHPGRQEALAVSRHLHQRNCDACHGADQSCIQVEERFLTDARHILDIARQARG